MNNIAFLAAKAMIRKDWQRLNPDERTLVRELEVAGYLKPAVDGFVGEVAQPLEPPVVFRYDRERGMFEFACLGAGEALMQARRATDADGVSWPCWRVQVGDMYCLATMKLTMLRGADHPRVGQEATVVAADGTAACRGRVVDHRFDVDGQNIFIVDLGDVYASCRAAELVFDTATPGYKDVHYGEVKI